VRKLIHADRQSTWNRNVAWNAPVKITKVDAVPIAIPLIRPHKLANFVLTDGYFVLVELEADEGLTGYGEAPLSMGPVFPEETWQGSVSLVKDYFAPLLTGKDPFDIDGIMHELDRAATRNFSTKSAIEIALHDLTGKAVGRPIYDLLGGPFQLEAPLSWSLATGSPEEEIREASNLVAEGHRIFKMKFGFLEPAEDIARLMALREALGPDIDLRIDVNQGWTSDLAIQAIRKIEKLDLRPTFIEQPVPAWDVKGLAQISRSVQTPIMVDEGLYTLADARSLIELDAADIFALKVPKHGGLRRAKQVAAIAEAADIPCYLGSNLDTGLGTLACLHFLASTPNITYGCELFGPKLLTNDILVEPIEYGPGWVRCPSRPGIGATLDRGEIDKYRIA
jgi:muconate cycloisomerase